MKLKYLGTAAAEGVPAIFCECENCKYARKNGGKDIRTRSQAIIDNKLLIDFPADTYMHFLKFDIPLYAVKSCIITHSHQDHLYVDDIKMRANGNFAHVKDTENPLKFFADSDGYEKIKSATGHISEKDVLPVRIEPFVPFETDGYRITPLRASHDPKTTPLLYIIEKDGKSIFYSHDSGKYCPETMNFLEKLSKPLSMVSFDCTSVCLDNITPSHLTFGECVEYKKEFIQKGIADENTVFVINHFSHNGKNVIHEKLEKVASKEGFLVSYDGMEVEI